MPGCRSGASGASSARATQGARGFRRDRAGCRADRPRSQRDSPGTDSVNDNRPADAYTPCSPPGESGVPHEHNVRAEADTCSALGARTARDDRTECGAANVQDVRVGTGSSLLRAASGGRTDTLARRAGGGRRAKLYR